MNTRALALATVPIVLAIAVGAYFASHETLHETPQVEIGGAHVAVELATTSAARSRGLSGRAGLAQGTGMLFVFPEDGAYAFWMKDMHFPIDIIWIDASGGVVSVADSVSPDSFPETVTPGMPARYVLEVQAGFAAARGVQVGSRVTLPHGTYSDE